MEGHWWAEKKESKCREHRDKRKPDFWETERLILYIPCPDVNERSCSLWLILEFYDKNSYTCHLISLDPPSVDFCSLLPRVPRGNTLWDSPLPSAFLSLHSVFLDDLIQTQAFTMSKCWWCACPMHTTPTLSNVYSIAPRGYPIDPSIQIPFLKWFVLIHFTIVSSTRNTIQTRTLNLPVFLLLYLFKNSWSRAG